MYYISSIIGRITTFTYRISNGIFGPFRSLFYNIRSLGRFNPFRSLRNSFYGVESTIRGILRLPASTRITRKASVSTDVPRAERTNRWRSRSRARVTQRAQYSQIHLIRQGTEERTIVHIGTIIGRSVSDIILDQPGYRAVQLRFAQVDPQQHNAPMMLTYLAGEATVKVNDVEVKREAPLADGAVIKIDDQAFECQLYAWDKEPIVTRVDAGWATDVGPERKENQDAIGIYQHESAYLFAVADGVGKGEYGAQVSEFAIRYLLAVFHQNVKYSLNWRDVLTKAYKYINAEVRHFARHSPTSEGSTLTAVVIKNMEATVAHVGDSRLYHAHDGVLKQMTANHVEHVAVEQETRVANEATEPPQMRDVLSKAIGKADTIQPDVFTISLQPGDRLLLCTDGITGIIDSDELEQIFGTMRAGRLAGHLVQLAVEREVKDNVSAIAIDVLKDPYVEDAWVAENEERIYANFSRSWPLRMKRPRELYTSYPVESRTGCWVLLGVVMVIAIVFFALRSQNTASAQTAQGDSTSAAVEQAAGTNAPDASPSVLPTEPPTATLAPTQPPTATFTATFPPTATRIRPTATPLVPPTPIPATSTLRPAAFDPAEPEAGI
jgi:PPM family protein phosphatase